MVGLCIFQLVQPLVQLNISELLLDASVSILVRRLAIVPGGARRRRPDVLTGPKSGEDIVGSDGVGVVVACFAHLSFVLL